MKGAGWLEGHLLLQLPVFEIQVSQQLASYYRLLVSSGWVIVNSMLYSSNNLEAKTDTNTIPNSS